MRIGDAHLTYCTNIYPAERGHQVEAIVSERVPKVVSELQGAGPFGVGLRLSNAASLDWSAPLDILPTDTWDTLRTHFHVPIFLERYGVLRSTQDAIVEVLEYQRNRPVTRHFEIETYTFDVLPPQLRMDRAASIARELQWVRDQLLS